MKIKKSTNEATDIDDDLIIFFAHLVKEISVTKYRSDKELIPAFTPYEVYQYSDSILKHLPKDALAKIKKILLYSKKNRSIIIKLLLTEEFTVVLVKCKLPKKEKIRQI